MNDSRLVVWKTFDPEGGFAGLVLADDALEATRKVPAGHSVYIGGPSPDHPDRPWWLEAWHAGAVDPDELLADDPRSPAE
jgi:hypothetical protein